MKTITQSIVILISFGLICYSNIEAAEKTTSSGAPKLDFKVSGYLLPVKPGLHKSITNPACSYVFDQNKKGFVKNDDRVVAWIRSNHDGGAIPLRHFLSIPRVVNDTYGLFFYDADGNYVSAFKADKGYEFYGWRKGVMLVKGKDGTIWSALSGRAIEGPKKGAKLKRIPNLMTHWGHWLTLHPKSVAYRMYDGKKYPGAELPKGMDSSAKQSMGKVDDRLSADTMVMGVEGANTTKAFPLDKAKERDCFIGKVDGDSVAVFWYKATKTAVTYSTKLGDRNLTFYADKTAPESAPFKDKETNSSWTIAGRAVEGPLKGSKLKWVNGVQCRWYAWAAEYPETKIFSSDKLAKSLK